MSKVEVGVREHVTDAEKWEFIRRCKALGQRGERINYRPARWHGWFYERLRISYGPDEEHLVVRVRRATPRAFMNENESMVVEVFKNVARWGWIDQIPHFLTLMRQDMILDELADL